jgi:hypothetical protein
MVAEVHWMQGSTPVKTDLLVGIGAYPFGDSPYYGKTKAPVLSEIDSNSKVAGAQAWPWYKDENQDGKSNNCGTASASESCDEKLAQRAAVFRVTYDS